ncbi:MAG: HAMP domain-containing protein [Elusimicrobia bacterium]|nr:HAMP domain-containing protein [Elusimicrobiota bacterium]
MAARRAGGLSIRGRLLLGSAGVILLFGGLVLAGLYRAMLGLFMEELVRRGYAIADTLLEPSQNLLLTEDSFALQQVLQSSLSRHHDVRYAFVADAEGRVVSHTFMGGFPKGLDRAVLLDPGEASRSRPVRTEEGLIYDVGVPLQGLGSIHVGMRSAEVARRVVRDTMGWGSTAAGALMLGAVVIWWLTGRLAARLKDLVGAAEEVGAGRLDAVVQDRGEDEVGRLARAFNAMTRDLKEYQARALRAGKLAAIGELASCVAHEINNPLNTMGVCAQALLERASSPELRASAEFSDFPEYLKTIDSEVSRCKRITSELLLFGHPREPRLEPVDLNELVSESLGLLEHRLRGAEAAVETVLAPGLPRLHADSDQLKQVLLNLVGNALDHIRPGGQVRIATAKHGRELALSVTDDGPGIPPEHRDKVFDLFFTTKKAGAGSGLGLAICQRIVDSHGGRIAVESRPGRGAVFTVSLPIR